MKESNIKVKLSRQTLIKKYNNQFKKSLKNNEMRGDEKLKFKIYKNIIDF